MSTPNFVGVRKHVGRVGKYTVEFTLSDRGIHAGWSPRIPRRLSREQQRQYLTLRNEFMGHVAEDLGGVVAVVDL